ncbi:MAG: hypothetical protein J7L72_03855, partial [Candidatus Aminicenantes bacterium]|nr:hypothetical protein [Candidatus Aminicenantes bacterium]
MKKTKFSLCLFLLLSNLLSAQQTDIYQRKQQFERSRDYDVVHYILKFTFDEDNKKYRGETT